MHKQGHFWIHSVLAIMLGLILVWGSIRLPSVTQSLVDGVGSVLYWLEKPAHELRLLVQSANNWVLERKTLHARVLELEAENLALRTAIQRMGWPVPEKAQNLLSAKVILRYPDAWWKDLRIDKGTRHGVRVGAPALSEGFLIGRVTRATETSAWVELITSSTFLMAAVVDKTRDLGVINGDDQGNVWLLYIPQEKKFERGMRLSTALVGELLPPGIPVGQIWGEGTPRDGFLPYKVVSGAHLTQLYGLQVLLGEEVRP